MSKRYEPQDIEKKWQKIWQDEKAFAATDDYTKPKYFFDSRIYENRVFDSKDRDFT